MQIVLEETVNISHVSSLKGQLVEAMNGEEAIEVDVSQVGTVDAAVLQLLAAFSLDAQAQDKQVDWGMPSDGFLGAVKLTGLQQVMQLD
jgi:ABC-type transporter Mla MlaB component